MNAAATIDPRKQNAADKRAKAKAAREWATLHNARVLAEREAAAKALADHVARWGEDGFECA